MKVEYVNPFILATRKVLNTMAFVESKPSKPYLKPEGEHKALGVISAVIELSGESKGSIAVSFSEPCILDVASQMFGETYTEMNDEVIDVVGELVNMISGEARRELAKLGFHFSAGIPITLKGAGHEMKHFVEARIIVIPFETKRGQYFIEACFDSSKFLD